MVAVEKVLHLRRQAVDLVEDELDLVGGQRRAGARQLEPDQVHQPDLRGERLRRRHAHLEPRARVEDGVDLARDLRAHLIRDRDGARAECPRELHRLDRVARLAGLRDADHERVGVDHRPPVDPFARDVGLDRDAPPLLEHVTPDDAGVVGGAAGDDHDPPQVAQFVLGHAEAVEHEPAVAHAIADRLREPFGLLVDLLEHERLVARALGDLLVPVDLVHLRLDRVAALRLDVRHAVGPQVDDDTVVGILDAARLGQERGQVGREEVLAAAETDDQRRLMPDCDEPLRLVVVDDDESEMPFESQVGGANRFDEIAVVERLEQVRDDFGVRLGGEGMTLVLERPFQLAKVLDDAVQDDGHVPVFAAGERVGVALGDGTVCRPAGVPEPVPRD